MVSNEIKVVYKNMKNIRKEYINQDSELKHVLEWNESADNDNKKEITEEMRNNLRTFYLNKIGEDNIKNSPDYDADLVSVDRFLAEITDLNFPSSFGSVFIKSFLIFTFKFWSSSFMVDFRICSMDRYNIKYIPLCFLVKQ